MSVGWFRLMRTIADRTAIKVDRNFGYAVFVSYAEVYNEKVRRAFLSCNTLMIDI